MVVQWEVQGTEFNDNQKLRQLAAWNSKSVPMIQPRVWAMDFRVVYLLFAAACQHFCGGSDPSSDIKSISKVFPT